MIDPLEKAVDRAAITKIIKTKDAEIASLRAERDELLSHWQIKHTHDLVAGLRAELAMWTDAMYERGLDRVKEACELLDGARRDAETIARLRETLRRIERESVDDVSRADARATFANA